MEELHTIPTMEVQHPLKGMFVNGEIANQLHNQIADALQEIGIVPKKADGEIGAEINPDSWLEQQGWVKIHTNYINFAGCLNEDNEYSKLKNVNMTNVQVKIIYEYISLCYDSVMKLGWRQEIVTAPRFQMLADVPEMMNEKYFSYK